MFFGTILKQDKSYTYNEEEDSLAILNLSNATLASGAKVPI